jgi:hypothetical protein
MEQVRRVQVKIDGQWTDTSMKDIKNGDVFRMFEPNGEEVIGTGLLAGDVNFVALEDAWCNDDGVWGADADGAEEESVDEA